jgi:GTP-binding protein
MAAGAFTSSEIAAGRRLFAPEWRFVAAAGSPAALPAMKGDEIAFVGRSNVGKSSLINALTNRDGLARTSRTPGRTQELVFFSADEHLTQVGLTLVDMPGYGYAAAPKAKVAAWTELIHAYLRGRGNLLRVYLLVDARRSLGAADDAILETLDAAAVSYQVVLTKADEVNAAGLDACLAGAATTLATHPAAFPAALATAAKNGTGIAELRAAIARLVAERHSAARRRR